MTFQMLSQTKLLSAAVFSVMLLDKRLNSWQWISLVLLTIGVFLSQADAHSTDGGKSFVKKSPPSLVGHLATPQPTLSAVAKELLSQNPVIGVTACVVSGLSSSFAGVYFEKVVKTTAPSLAVRNIHLGLFGIPLAVLSMLVIDVIPSMYAQSPQSVSATNNNLAITTAPQPFEFWRGYNALTVMLVFVHALGGLLVAVVAKYADNILKGFATGVAIVVSGLFGWVFWAYTPTVMFVLGCLLVTVSTVAYHVHDKGVAHYVSGGIPSGIPTKDSKEVV
jgi:UDP-sugar transporter A1/2/3